MEIDALGTYNMSHSVYPAMARSSTGGGKGGVIINISMTLHYGATWYQVSAWTNYFTTAMCMYLMLICLAKRLMHLQLNQRLIR